MSSPGPGVQIDKDAAVEDNRNDSKKHEVVEEDQMEKTNARDEESKEEEEDDETECGFCLFMKGGGCKDSFIAWENCVEEAEKNKEDIVEKCFEVTAQLRQCMSAHADYYEPILRVERGMDEEITSNDKEVQSQTASDDTAVGISTNKT